MGLCGGLPDTGRLVTIDNFGKSTLALCDLGGKFHAFEAKTTDSPIDADSKPGQYARAC